MPRAFTASETDRIRERLRRAGREAFARRGLRATTVEQLAQAAGISKGAFYRFYDSKESLLVELASEIEIAMQAQIEAAVRDHPGRGIDVLVDGAVHAVERNPLIPVLMSPEGLHALQSRPPDELAEFLDRDVRLVDRVLAVLQDAGSAPPVPAPVLLGLLRSLVFVGQHRGDIGAGLVDAAAAWIAGQLRTALLPREAGPGEVKEEAWANP